MSDAVYGRIMREIRAYIEDNTDFLARGGAEDYTRYAGVVGVINGLRLALTTVEKVYSDTHTEEELHG